MSNAIASVIIASAQSVAKVFIIGGVGYFSVLYPRKAPLLPRQHVGMMARFSFCALSLPLIYSSIAVAITIETVGNYWFVIVGGFGVLSVSYLVATLTSYCIPISNHRDFLALRIAATFPNIVSLPILLFPSLCEFPVVYEGYTIEPENGGDSNNEPIPAAELQQQCVAQSTTMVFCYFFSWSLCFWSFGNNQLMYAAKQVSTLTTATTTTADTIQQNEAAQEAQKSSQETNSSVNGYQIDPESPNVSKNNDYDDSASIESLQEHDYNENVGNGPLVVVDTTTTDNVAVQLTEDCEEQCEEQQQQQQQPQQQQPPSLLESFWNAIKQTATSPGFIAMVLAFITACIPPLQQALFDGTGALRFLGSAIETLGMASTPMSTLVVAASLVPPSAPTRGEDDHEEESNIIEENPAMTDPNFGPYRRRRRRTLHRASQSMRELRRSLQSGSMRILHAVPRPTPEMRRLHIWFCLSRLFVTPAVIVGLIVALDCGGGWLSGVPNLAKLVIIVNAALPGALIVIVMLKSQEELAETAAAVAKIYLPSYLLSIVTIAAWTAVGLWITLPDDDGKTVCQRV